MKLAALALGTTMIGGLAFAGAVTALPPGTEDFNSSDRHLVDTCGEDDKNELWVVAPDNLWPPNHKYYDDLAVIAIDGDGDGTVSLVSTGSHDQYESTEDGTQEMGGSGNTTDDITVDDEDAEVTDDGPEDGDPEFIAVETDDDGSVDTDWRARSERSGQDLDGRQYTLGGTATFDDESVCEGSYTFTVPHDMRKSNRNGGEPTDGSTRGNGKKK